MDVGFFFILTVIYADLHINNVIKKQLLRNYSYKYK